MEQSSGVRATAFGLDLYSEIPLSFLEGSVANPTGRTLKISVLAGDAAKLAWPQYAELVCDERQPDGSVNFQIEAHPEAGYLTFGPEYGTSILSADGSRVTCAPEGHPEGAWQRLLVAQVLPFAALLHGLEVFHSSAVVRRGEAVAFLGSSHTGKTSLAGVDHAEVERLSELEPFAPERIVAVNDREQLVHISGAPEPAPLGALFFLDRRADGPERPSFEPAADAQLLLTATFNFVLSTPERLRGLLDVCALAAKLRVERIAIGPATDASELGLAVEQRLGALT
jgi:hypothetical protein